MEIPALKDLIQQCSGNLEVPEIRVWCHPDEGDDYYEIFSSFQQALTFIKNNSTAERVPLIAFRGYEINIFVIKELTHQKRKKKN